MDIGGIFLPNYQKYVIILAELSRKTNKLQPKGKHESLHADELGGKDLIGIILIAIGVSIWGLEELGKNGKWNALRETQTKTAPYSNHQKPTPRLHDKNVVGHTDQHVLIDGSSTNLCRSCSAIWQRIHVRAWR